MFVSGRMSWPGHIFNPRSGFAAWATVIFPPVTSIEVVESSIEGVVSITGLVGMVSVDRGLTRSSFSVHVKN